MPVCVVNKSGTTMPLPLYESHERLVEGLGTDHPDAVSCSQDYTSMVNELESKAKEPQNTGATDCVPSLLTEINSPTIRRCGRGPKSTTIVEGKDMDLDGNASKPSPNDKTTPNDEMGKPSFYIKLCTTLKILKGGRQAESLTQVKESRMDVQ